LFAKLKNVDGILDFYHAAQNVYKGAKAKFDGRTIDYKTKRMQSLTYKRYHLSLQSELWASFIFQLTHFLYDLSYVETHGSASPSRERANIFWFLISKH